MQNAQHTEKLKTNVIKLLKMLKENFLKKRYDMGD